MNHNPLMKDTNWLFLMIRISFVVVVVSLISSRGFADNSFADSRLAINHGGDTAFVAAVNGFFIGPANEALFAHSDGNLEWATCTATIFRIVANEKTPHPVNTRYDLDK